MYLFYISAYKITKKIVLMKKKNYFCAHNGV